MTGGLVLNAAPTNVSISFDGKGIVVVKPIQTSRCALL